MPPPSVLPLASANAMFRRRSMRVKAGLVFIVALIVVTAFAYSVTRPRTVATPVLAAIVNGLPVTMASYRRQLVYATAGYAGPGTPDSSPTGRTISQLISDRAIQQAIAEVLIDNAAGQHRIGISEHELAVEITRITVDVGGLARLREQMAAARMSQSDLAWVARHNILRAKIGSVLHDPAWLDHLVARATVRYFVSDGAAGVDNAPAVSLDHPAPPFVAVDLLGTPVSLAALHGRVIILNFWATWCGYCVQELPMLLEFARAHPAYAVVALDHLEAPGAVQRYIQTHHLEGLTVWLDTTGDAYANYTMTGLPATFFIDRHGIMRSYNFGALSDRQSLADQASLTSRGLDNTYYNQGR